MKNRTLLTFCFVIIAVILAAALIKAFDFENLKFRNWRLAIIYIGALCLSLYLFINNFKKQSEK